MHAPEHEDDLLGFALGELEVVARREVLVERLAHCDECAHFAYALLPTLLGAREGQTVPARYEALLSDAALAVASADARRSEPVWQRLSRWVSAGGWVPLGAATAAAVAVGVWALWPASMGEFRAGVSVVRNANLSAPTAAESGAVVEVAPEDSLVLEVPSNAGVAAEWVAVVSLTANARPGWLEGIVAGGALSDPEGQQRGAIVRSGAAVSARFSAAVFVSGAAQVELVLLGCEQPGLVAERAGALRDGRAEDDALAGCARSQAIAVRRAKE